MYANRPFSLPNASADHEYRGNSGFPENKNEVYNIFFLFVLSSV
jgi:hypothetical protein